MPRHGLVWELQAPAHRLLLKEITLKSFFFGDGSEKLRLLLVGVEPMFGALQFFPRVFLVVIDKNFITLLPEMGISIGNHTVFLVQFGINLHL